MNRKHRSGLVGGLFVALVIAGSIRAQDKEFREIVPLQPGETVTLKTYKGSIHISPWDRAEVSVYARITAPSDEGSEYAERVVEATKVEIRRRSNGVSIRSDYDDVPSRGTWFAQIRNLAYVHYEIQVPREVNLSVDDNKSEIEVYDLSGKLDIDSYKGKIFGSGLSGEIRIETYKGNAQLQALRGSLDVETYKGEVNAEALQIDGDSRLETYKGEIQLSVPQNQALTVRGETGRRGSFTSDFQLEKSPESKSRRSSGRLDTEINQGGPRLAVSTHKGEIRLKRL